MLTYICENWGGLGKSNARPPFSVIGRTRRKLFEKSNVHIANKH